MPEPYIKLAISHSVPSNCASNRFTLARVNTTGRRAGFFGALNAVHPRQINLEHFTIQKQNGIECLILRGSRDISAHCQVREKCRNLDRTHVTWVALVVEKYKTPRPTEVTLLGADAVMLKANCVADLIEQTWSRTNGMHVPCHNTLLGGHHLRDQVY